MNPVTVVPSAIDLYLFQAMPGNSLLLLPDAPHFTILAATDDYLQNSGRSREELAGKGLFEVYPHSPDDAGKEGERVSRDSLEYAMSKKEPHRLPVCRYDITAANGLFEERYWSVVNKPVLDETGEVVYLIHTAEDLTGQMKAGQADEKLRVIQSLNRELQTVNLQIRASEEKYRSLFNSVDQGFCVIEMLFDPDLNPVDYIFLEVNSVFEAQTGLKDAAGKRVKELVPDLDVHWLEIYGRVALTGEPIRFEERSKSLGRWFDVYAFRVNEPQSRQVALLFSDISRRKLSEQALRESEERFRRMANAVPQSIWITDAEGRTEFLNKHWCDYCGVPYSETTAADIAVKYLHPEDAPKVMAAFGKAMQTGEPFEVEQRNRSWDGQYRWFLNRAAPYRDCLTGKITKWFGVGVDIHDRKLAEQALRQSEAELEKKVQERTADLEKANMELKRSNANLEQFAYAASHDLKEPIRKINVFAGRLKDSLGSRMTEMEKNYFERMELASKRMNTLIDDLLTYSEASQKAAAKEDVDLNFIIDCVLSDLDLEIEQKHATIRVDQLFSYKGNRRQLQQAFQNLISNALKYTRPQVPPVITIEGSIIHGRESGLPLTPEEQAKQYHQVAVRDNGIGFEQEDAERIFSMFTRLHGMAEFKGSGIGLPIVKKVVENHGGYVMAEGKPGQGASFRVMLPCD